MNAAPGSFWHRSSQPISHAALGPADAAISIPAQKTEMAAVRYDLDLDVRGRLQSFERLGGNKRIVPCAENECRHAHAAKKRQRRRPLVVIEGAGVTAAGGRVQVVELK